MKAEPQKTFPPALRACWIKLNYSFAKKLQKLGLTPDQYSVLRWIYELKNKEICQKDLTKLMYTDPNNIAAMLKRMERQRLIKRKSASNDKRKKIIMPTKLGKQKLLRGLKVAFLQEKLALSGLSEKEKSSLLDNLKRISNFLNNDG